MNYRPVRVGKLIREELSLIVVREMEFPNTLVTLVDVEVSKKLDVARVYVSILPEDAQAKVLKRLNGARGMLQYHLIKKLNIKPMPELEFKLDKGNLNAAVVEKAFLETAE